MDEKEIKDIVASVSNNDFGFKFIQLLLEKLGAFERGVKFDNTNMEYYNRGKREQGLWLLDLIQKYNFEKFILLERERKF